MTSKIVQTLSKLGNNALKKTQNLRAYKGKPQTTRKYLQITHFKNTGGDFPDGSVVKTPQFLYRGHGFDIWWGN